MKRAILFTDGSCLGKSRPGTRAYLLRCGPIETELAGTEAYAINNQMELHAVIAGLR